MADNAQDDAPPPGQDESAEGFGAAFAERAEQPAGDKPEAGAEPQGSAEGAADDEAAPELTPAPAAAGDQGSGQFDPYAGMTPEQQAHWERVLASERSQRGRVGALTKKLNATASAPAQPAPKPSEGQGEAGDKPETVQSLDDKLKAIADGEYGDVVGPVVEVVAAMKAEIDKLQPSEKREAAPVTDAEVEEAARAYDALGEKHPDYAQIANDPEFFNGWLGKQSPKVLALANSNDPEEVSLALSLYKAERGAPTQPGSDEGGKGGKAEGRRQRQLEGSRQPAAKGAGAAAGTPNDFSSGFKARQQQHKAA